MAGRMNGKVAIVTGGAMGIGEATCLAFAREGAKVAVLDINDEAGRQVVSSIAAEGGAAHFWHVEVTDSRQIASAFAEVNEKFGKINVLVNNAGIHGVGKPTDEIGEDEWDRVIGVDLRSVFLCTKHVIPYMKKAGGGSIVNLSSILGLVGGADPPYHAAKGGVRLLTKSDAFYYGKDKIRVNSVHPGYTFTPMMKGMMDDSGEGENFKKMLADMSLLGRMGEPTDIANGILYLASDESSFVTGAELVIDGGVTAV